MASQEFEVPPPGKFALMFLLVFGAIMPLIVLSTVTLTAHDSKVMLLTAPLALVFPLVAGGIGWSIFRRKIRLVDKTLRTGIFGWRGVPMSELDLANAAIVDLNRHPELHPTFKLAGTSMPGYRSGWFRLRDKRTAYLILTVWDRALVIPKFDGKVLLLSPQRPEALLDAMRRAAG
jgi:hypothetical protein